MIDIFLSWLACMKEPHTRARQKSRGVDNPLPILHDVRDDGLNLLNAIISKPLNEEESVQLCMLVDIEIGKDVVQRFSREIEPRIVWQATTNLAHTIAAMTSVHHWFF